jgi:hypothetical protein
MGILHEDVCTFMVVVAAVAVKMARVSMADPNDT